MKLKKLILLGAALVLSAGTATAQDATIRKSFAQHLPQLKSVDEINKTAVERLYEVRINETDIVYTDASGSFLFDGKLVDLKAQRNLTEERVNKLTAIKFKDLPVKDAITIVRGNGQRKLAVFEDPNCGYCKRFERDLQSIDNVTVHIFLFPVLGPDSTLKSKAIWCAKDQGKAWLDWMVKDGAVPTVPESCESAALSRNIEFGKKHKITGTPTLIFADDSRIPGAIDAKRIESLLVGHKG